MGQMPRAPRSWRAINKSTDYLHANIGSRFVRRMIVAAEAHTASTDFCEQVLTKERTVRRHQRCVAAPAVCSSRTPGA